MRKGTVKIENDVLHYNNSNDYHKSAYFKTKSFSVKISDIKIIGILYTMNFDDESDVLIFFDKNGYVGSIPLFYDLEEEYLNLLIDSFSFNKYFFRDKNPNFLDDISEDYYDKGKSFVLYPEELESQPLYKKNIFNEIVMTLPRLLKIREYSKRILTKENRAYLDK